MDLALVLGAALSIAIAIWQNRRAAAANGRTETLIANLPKQISVELRRIGTIPGSHPTEAGQETPSSPLRTSYADVDNDGRPELLVQYNVGAHGSALEVFGMRNMEFHWIGGLRVGTAAGFTVKDFDHDGLVEIGTKEADWSTDLPYYLAPRINIWYRWDGDSFTEVAKNKDYSDDDLVELRRRAVEES